MSEFEAKVRAYLHCYEKACKKHNSKSAFFWMRRFFNLTGHPISRSMLKDLQL